MSTMTPRDRTKWAKEEIASALEEWLKERLQQIDIDNLDDELELKKQVNRVLKRLK